MTKAKAKKLMLEYSREVVEPAFASKITQAFGFSLSDLEIKPRPLSTFPILVSEESKSIKAVAMKDVARELALKITGERVYSNMNGHGSSAEDITRKAIALI